MMKITGLSHLFKWENLHNWWLTKYFFAPLYIYIIYIYICIYIRNVFISAVREALSQMVTQHLRWIMQKDLLGQDVFLIGPPGPLRRSIAMQYLVISRTPPPTCSKCNTQLSPLSSFLFEFVFLFARN